MISGILPVDKPLGWTSHDVVARVRRVAGQRQVGHAGTLDPLATGVLLLVLGQATRFSSHLMNTEKEYCADIVLGATTATDDGEGPLLEARPAAHIGRVAVETLLPQFTGTIEQAPPRYSAVRRGGEKLYVRARRGEVIEVEPRSVTIHAIELERWEPRRLRVQVRCASGTYIRSLARDIGAALGVGAYLHALRRIRSGSFRVDACVPLNQMTEQDTLLRHLVPSDRAVYHWPAWTLSAEEKERISHGCAIHTARQLHGSIRMYDLSGHLVALGEGVGDSIKPFRVFDGGSDAPDH